MCDLFVIGGMGGIFHWRSSHYTATHLRNKNSNIQGRSPYVVKLIIQTIKNCSERNEFAPSVIKFFPLRQVPILKRGVIEENHCLFQ